MVGICQCHIPTPIHYDIFPPGGNMTGGNMLVSRHHDRHHHHHYQAEYHHRLVDVASEVWCNHQQHCAEADRHKGDLVSTDFVKIDKIGLKLKAVGQKGSKLTQMSEEAQNKSRHSIMLS